MKNLLLIASILSLVLSVNAQVGINTTSPKSTLDVVGEPTVITTFDGVMPPRIEADQLSAKTYTVDQTGAIVYVTVSPTLDSTANIQTEYVDFPGLYFFDGETWVSFITSKRKNGVCISGTESNGNFTDNSSNGSDLTIGNYNFQWFFVNGSLSSQNNHLRIRKNTNGDTKGLTEHVGGSNLASTTFSDIISGTYVQKSEGFVIQSEHASEFLFVTTEPEVYKVTVIGGKDNTSSSNVGYLCYNVSQLF